MTMPSIRLILASSSPLEHIASKDLFHIGWFRFTNHMFMISVATMLLMISLPLILRKRQLIPSGFVNLIEAVCVFIRDEIARPFLKDETDKYVPCLWTLFFFILSLNLLGLVPIDRILSITGNHNLGGTATANIWVTGALATFSFLLFHISGMIQNGFFKYWKNFTPKVPLPMMPFMFFMELVSTFVRLFSLALRLFANMLAGHILLGTVLGFILIFKNSFVATASVSFIVLMSLLELFVAFLQAYIFVFLTTIFIGFAIHQDH